MHLLPSTIETKHTAAAKATDKKGKKSVCMRSHLKPIPLHRDVFIHDEIKLPAANCKICEKERSMKKDNGERTSWQKWGGEGEAVRHGRSQHAKKKETK